VNNLRFIKETIKMSNNNYVQVAKDVAAGAAKLNRANPDGMAAF
jgi:ankyrin repeat protein